MHLSVVDSGRYRGTRIQKVIDVSKGPLGYEGKTGFEVESGQGIG